MSSDGTYQRFRVAAPLRAELVRMFADLGEPEQMLTVDSPRPLVVHRAVGQLTFVAGGRGLAVLGGEQIAIEEGDLLLIAPGCTHSFHAPGPPLRLRHWHWPPAALADDRAVLRVVQEFAPR
jgi:mannose-6-phosphate isomerase-like protein (cupin superfamily)